MYLFSFSYIHFDFHRECKGMRYDRLNHLIADLEGFIAQQGFYFQPNDGQQQGIIRTNCIDCLDRTNAVQSMIGKNVLLKQLRQLKLLSAADDLPVQAFEVFKHLWADNGDAISRQYSGTGALKADFTRTGKRRWWGPLQDGWRSLIRYYLNNFADGAKQDAMDLFFGHFTPQLDQISPFIQQQELLNTTVPLGTLAIGFTCWMASITGRVDPSWNCGLIGACLTILSLLYIYLNGHAFVQYPRLIPPPVIIKARAAHYSNSNGLLRALRKSPKVHAI